MAPEERGLSLRGSIYHMVIGVHGRIHRESTRTTKLSEARAYRREVLARLLRSKGRSATRSTIGDLLNEKLATYRAAGQKATADRAEDTLAHFDRHIMGGLRRRAATLTSEELTEYVNARVGKDGAKLGTVCYELSILRAAYRAKAKDHALPVPTFPSIDPHNARQGFLEEHEVRQMLDHLMPPDTLDDSMTVREQKARVRRRNEPVALIIRFLSITGWRSAEAKHLTWDRIDWRRGMIVLHETDTKTREPRMYPFGEVPELGALLSRAYELTRQAEKLRKAAVRHVFHRQGKPIKDFLAAFHNAAKAIGRPGIVPHDLRRSVVNQLVEAHIPKEAAKSLTGHKSDAVFYRYNIINHDSIRAGARAYASHRAKLTEGAGPESVHNPLHNADQASAEVRES